MQKIRLLGLLVFIVLHVVESASVSCLLSRNRTECVSDGLVWHAICNLRHHVSRTSFTVMLTLKCLNCPQLLARPISPFICKASANSVSFYIIRLLSLACSFESHLLRM